MSIFILTLFVLILTKETVAFGKWMTPSRARAIRSQPLNFQPKKTNPSTKNGKNVVAKETIVVPQDYKVSLGFLATSALLWSLHLPFISIPLGLLSILLIIQTGKVNFVFDDEAMEILIKKGEGLEKSRDNIVVGGRNRWKYSSFVDWYFWPSFQLPILFYFYETQTKPEGQVHLFPVLLKAEVLNKVVTERVGVKKV